MPFPKDAQSRGGKHPNSEKQKEIARSLALARQTIAEARAAITERGRSISSLNRVKTGIFNRLVKSWEVDDFEKTCGELEKAIAAFERDKVRHPDRYSSLTVRRFPGHDDKGNRWLLVVIYSIYRGANREIAPRLRFADTIRDRFHHDGAVQYTQVGFD